MANTVIVNPDFLIDGSPIIDNQTELQNSISENTFLNADSSVDVYVYSSGLLNNIVGVETYTVGRNSDNQFVADLNIDEDLELLDITAPGEYNLVYHFNQLVGQTSDTNLLRIEEISPSRTEISLSVTNNLNDVINDLGGFIDYFNISDIQVLLYLNPGDGRLFECTNIQLDVNNPLAPRVYLKLDSPLLNEYTTGDTFYLVQPITAPVSYTVIIQPEEIVIDEIIDLGRPNITSATINYQNPGTRLLSLSDILTNPIESSRNEIENFLSQSGLSLNIDHNNYEDFVFYSSAERRLENFYEKVVDIENYSSSLARLSNTPGGATTRQTLQNNINSIIRGFTFYENFLYYTSGSNAWPKKNDKPPFLLQPTGSIEVLEWFGSTNPRNQYFGGQILSSSNYDQLNKNSLFYNIPQYLRDDEQNDQYKVFVDMIGEHFDEIWLYTKDITNKFDGDNRINFGISKDLVSDAIKDFSLRLYQNNFSSKDIYNAFLGINDSGSFFPFNDITTTLPASSSLQYIDNLISSSNFPIPVDDINKRLYKRIYHNIPYLLRSKGSLSNIRTILNIYGIPRSILDIYQYGGKDRVNTNDWDLYREIYNKEISTGIFNELNYIQGGIYSLSDYTLSQYNSQIITPISIPSPKFDGVIAPKGWKLNADWNLTPSVPRTVEFRFKSLINPNNLSFQPDIKQALFLKGERNGNDITNTEVAISLEYNGSGSYSGSYSGSITDPNNKNANLVLYISGSSQYYSASISDIPLLNQDWWSVMLQYTSESNSYNLYTSNKIYNGDDGTSIGYFKTSSLTLPTYQDTAGYRSNNKATFSTFNSCSFDNITLKKFSGSFQEIRYWTNLLDESKWKNHVMNPLSIEGNELTGSNSTQETLAFRTREGEDYSVNNIDIISNNIESIHPKITGSFTPTASFETTIYNAGEDSHYLVLSGSFLNNNETVFLNQPIIGIKNRISDKIRIEDAVVPTDNMLSAYTSFIQDPLISQSYSPNLNYVEIGFSPANQVNDDIINSLGGFDIGELIGDPRLRSSSALSYPELDNLRDEYFQKYFKTYNVADFIRLINNYDNSLFKMIKDFTPLRSNTNTGIIIKQSLLERQKYPEPKIIPTTTIAKKPNATANPSLTGSFSLQLNGDFATNTIFDPLVLINGLSSSIGVKTYDGIISEVTTPLLEPTISGSIISNNSTIGIELNIGNTSSAGPESNTVFYIGSSQGDPSNSYLKFDINNNPTTFGSLYGTNLQNLSTNFTLSVVENEIIYPVIFTNNQKFDSFTITGSVLEATTIRNNTELKFKDISLTGSVKSTARGYTTGSTIQVVSGSTGGVFNEFNSISPRLNVTQSNTYIGNGLSGSIQFTKISQDEFYNGELSGSHIILTTQSLNPDCKKYLNVFIGGDDTFPTQSYDVFVYGGINTITSSFSSFANAGTRPAAGEMYVFNNGSSGSLTLNRNYVQKIKISTTDKEGNYNYDLFRNAERLEFTVPQLPPSLVRAVFRKNVTVDEVTSTYVSFIPNDTFFSNSDTFFDASKRININISSSDGSGSVGPTYCEEGFVSTYNLPIGNFDNTSGTTTLLDEVTGNYTFPYTPNQLFSITASVSARVSCSDANEYIPQARLDLLQNNSIIASSNLHEYSQLPGGIDQTATLTLSHSFNPNVPIQGDNLRFEIFHRVRGDVSVGAGGWVSGSLSASNASFIINTGSFNITNITGSTMEQVNPYTPVVDNMGFDRAFDCQPLFNNFVTTEEYKKYQVVDYTKGLIKPTNFSLILQNKAEKAETPESNYTQKSSTLLKYDGSKLSGLKINQYTPPSTNENLILLNGEAYRGDISYGATPVINSFKTYFGYFNLVIPTSPELENHTQVKLRYLIDGTGTVFKPILNTPTYFNVIDNYETGDIISINLNNTLQTDDQSLTNAAVGTNLDNYNINGTVLRGGQRIDPILSSQVYSVFDNDNELITLVNSDGSTSQTELTRGLFRRINAYTDNIGFDSPESVNNDYSTGVFISKNLNGGSDPATEGSRVNIGSITPATAGPLFSSPVLGVITGSYIGITNSNLDPLSQYNNTTNKIVFSQTPETRVKFKLKLNIDIGNHAYSSNLYVFNKKPRRRSTNAIQSGRTRIVPPISPVSIRIGIYRRRAGVVTLADVVSYRSVTGPQGLQSYYLDATDKLRLGVYDPAFQNGDYAGSLWLKNKIIGIGQQVGPTVDPSTPQILNTNPLTTFENLPAIETRYLDIQSGDEFFYLFTYNNPTLQIFNNLDVDFGVDSDDAIDIELLRRTFKPRNVSFVSFQAIPEFRPTEYLTTTDMWTTGSSNDSFLTGSLELTRYYDTVKQELSASQFQLVNGGPTTFKPINENFTIKYADQFRFEGLESKVHTVKFVDESTANSGSSGELLGRILVEVVPPVPPGVDLSKFLIRRFNDDASSIITNIDPPSTGFATTTGIITHDFETNITNIDEIIDNLVNQGIITE